MSTDDRIREQVRKIETEIVRLTKLRDRWHAECNQQRVQRIELELRALEADVLWLNFACRIELS